MNFYRWLNYRHSEKQLRKIKQAADDPVTFPAMTWAEEMKDVEAAWAARPWYRKVYDKVYYKLFGMSGLFNYQLNPRVLMNRVVWRYQRSKRGWADYDTWSTDSCIAKVISEMLSHMADHTLGYPGQPPFETPEKWETHLRDLSARLRAWNSDTWTNKDAFQVTQDALKEFAANFGMYWD